MQLFPALAVGLKLCGLRLKGGKSFSAASVQHETCIVFVSFHLGDMLEIELGFKFSHLGAVANEQNQIHSSSSSTLLPFPVSFRRDESQVLSAFSFLQFTVFYRLRFGFALWHHRLSHEGNFVLVVFEGSSLAVAPFAHF